MVSFVFPSQMGKSVVKQASSLPRHRYREPRVKHDLAKSEMNNHQEDDHVTGSGNPNIGSEVSATLQHDDAALRVYHSAGRVHRL
jgi:hypothetical protein